MTVAEQLAQTLTDVNTVPAEVSAKVIDAIQDLTASALAGLGTPAVEASKAAAARIWGGGAAVSWFSDTRLTVPGAAYLNATLSSVMDLDDGHRAAVGHPGAGIVPAVLATCDVFDAPFESVITAIAIGYEVAVRIAASRHHSKLTTMVSGPWIGQGVAAAAAHLRKMPPHQMAQAIALAGASAPNLLAVGYSKVMGNHLKEGIPWATAAGLSAVDLADAGFTGPIDLLDNEEIYRRKILLDDLGEKWVLPDVYFKPYSCCRWAHAAMDAALQLQAEHRLEADEIRRIDIETFGWALRLNNDVHPASLESAQYSVPFCVALVLTAGADAFLPMSEAALSDTRAVTLAEKVRLLHSDRFEAMFPQAVPAKLTIHTSRGRWGCEVLTPLGEATNPMTAEHMRAKFQSIAASKLAPVDAERIDKAFQALRNGQLQKFKNDLAAPLTVYSGTTRLTG
ncbi:MmgE/PrpD family protein [Breoghania sp. L-A4]|uniref:MmgE/PrpD family protein n=1 Tax=Breoghania sp. L-A4 TaxID=2304600 RepID=UPI000E360541|nr:MmgE/PrpD family protein [Breoghania sp. L-A4]AXS40063.1 MmgE/PrpD family protein [Breoghania sp. L-A4]